MTRERGSGTVLVLAVLGAMSVVLASALLVLSAMQARGCAQTAADLGALAAAGHGDQSCEVARWVIAANGAELTMCAVEGHHVRLQTEAPVYWAGRQIWLRARAVSHAGPVGVP